MGPAKPDEPLQPNNHRLANARGPALQQLAAPFATSMADEAVWLSSPQQESRAASLVGSDHALPKGYSMAAVRCEDTAE